MRQIQKCRKRRKKDIDNGEPQISMADAKVNSTYQEAIDGAHYRCHILNNQNRRSVCCLQEKKIIPLFLLEEVVRNDSIKHGPVKASVHPVEDHITREVAVESS